MMLYVDRYLCHVWVLCCRNTFDPLITLTPTMDKDVTSSCKLCSWLNMEKVCKEFRFLRLSPTFPLKLELFHMGKCEGNSGLHRFISIISTTRYCTVSTCSTTHSSDFSSIIFHPIIFFPLIPLSGGVGHIPVFCLHLHSGPPLHHQWIPIVNRCKTSQRLDPEKKRHKSSTARWQHFLKGQML